MDRSWMQLNNIFSHEYIQGIHNFMDAVACHVDSNGRIRCQCKNCNNCYLKTLSKLKQDY